MKERVLAYLSEHGFAVASKIGEILGTDSFVAGAILSELLEAKQVAITRSKFGAAYYYLPGSDALEKLMEKLSSPNQQIVQRLKSETVLRISELDPQSRIRLGEVSDYAQKISIKLGEEVVEFIKWYAATNEDVVGILQKKYAPRKEPSPKSAPSPTPSPPLNKTQVAPLTQYSTQAIKEHLKSRAIAFESYLEVKKGTEADAVCSIPTELGNQQYFVKIRVKKKINDADLSEAFMQGVMKHLPVCFVTNGELTKKAAEMLKAEFKGMLFVRV